MDEREATTFVKERLKAAAEKPENEEKNEDAEKNEDEEKNEDAEKKWRRGPRES